MQTNIRIKEMMQTQARKLFTGSPGGTAGNSLWEVEKKNFP